MCKRENERERGKESQRWHSGGMPGDYFVTRGIALRSKREREGERERNGQKSNKRLCFDLAW